MKYGNNQNMLTGGSTALGANAGAAGDGDVIYYSPEDTSSKTAYRHLIEDIETIAANMPQLKHTYLVKDYMYFDYDGDGENEVILYFSYKDADDVYCRDTVFLDYSVDSGVYVRAFVNDGDDDSYFYAEYYGKLARYSWRTNPLESYLYCVDCSKTLTYVLEKSYDEIIVDLKKEGLYPLPLYGSWEIGPFLD